MGTIGYLSLLQGQTLSEGKEKAESRDVQEAKSNSCGMGAVDHQGLVLN